MLTTSLIIVALLIAAVLLIAAMKPKSFHISRAAMVGAQADRVYSLVNDLKTHRSWSPFDADPAMKRHYSSETAGKGASLDFDGGRTCVGRLAITDAKPHSEVTMSLKMSKPFKCDNIVEFTFVPARDAVDATHVTGTHVTWAMHGPQPFMARLMSTFVNCDRMVGKQFEQGLSKLKSLAEA
jgi:hypothetical protein